MLELARGLSSSALQALADLERRTVAHDGGRLKLEWQTLRTRPGREVEDLLWWDGDRLVGFAGIYAFGPPTVEVAGMVDPELRRRGIATALLEAALPLCRDRRYSRLLLVTPRATEAGRAFALARGAQLEHSEHALVQRDSPPDGPEDPAIQLRPATPDDAEAVAASLRAAFGSAPPDLRDRLAADDASTLLVLRSGEPIGTLRVSHDGTTGGVYGFGIDPQWRGQGIGRDVLRRACKRLRADGAREVGLEVAVDNEHALGLYTSLGFVPVSTEDYYRFPL